MDKNTLLEILKGVEGGAISPDEAASKLSTLSYENLEFANVDHHRALRTGFPEVIYCEGKSPHQITAIANSLWTKSPTALIATRANKDAFDAVRNVCPNAVYHQASRLVTVGETPAFTEETVAVVTAGTADIAVAEEAAITLTMLGVPVERVYDVGVAGLHRLIGNLDKIAKCSVVIVVAGMEGALASVVGGLVSAPVIAVPTSIGYGASFGGLAALLSMLNSCASGVGVCNIDNGFGAAWLAYRILKK